MRCPTCNALNPPSAEWCTQCFTSLRPPEPEPEPAAEAEPGPASGSAVAPSPAPASDTADAGPGATPGAGEPARIVQRGNATFRRTAEGLDWQCGRCDSFNPIDVQHCTICGYGFADTVRDPDEAFVPAVDENVALLASAILPGAGHYLAGRKPAGVGRAVMYLVFVIGGWLLLREAAGSGQSPLPAVPLLLGAVVIWGASAFDAVMLVRGSNRQLLEGRVFFWLVVGVLGLLMATFAAAALSVSGT